MVRGGPERPRQVNPYLVVDAVPIEDEREGETEERRDGNADDSCDDERGERVEHGRDNPRGARGAAAALRER